MSDPSNGHSGTLIADENTPLVPGTTIPREAKGSTQIDLSAEPVSIPGPTINSLPTIVTLYEPSQLAVSPLLPLLPDVVNTAFSKGHSETGTLPGSVDRLRSIEQFLSELGNIPGTFTYIVHSESPVRLLATVSAQRWLSPPKAIVGVPADERSTFKRSGEPSKSFDEWELRMMAVDTTIQRQGLAGYMMNLAEEEIRRRHVSLPVEQIDEEMNVNSDSENAIAARSTGLMLILTTMKEINEGFYTRKGFQKDYETAKPKGYMDSPQGFTVIHMSKRLE